MGAVSHIAALHQNTGATWGAESWAKGQRRQDRLIEQTRRLAGALERHGVRTRLPSEVLTLGEVTGAVAQADAWRAIRFLPAVAQRDRQPMLSALKLWQRGEDGRWLRYAVITSGERVPLGGDLRGRQAEHTRAVSRWAHEARRDHGIEVLFRGTEYTVAAEGIHLHSNVLYRPVSKLSPERWAEFLLWSRRRLGAHWRDCGRIKDMAEVVKYAVKPADLEALDDEHLVWLYHQTFGLKLCQPMGKFAAWLRGLERDGLKVAQVVDPVGGGGERRKSRLKLVEKPRRDPKPKKPTRHEGEDEAGDDADVPQAGEAPERVGASPAREVAENVLIARTLPQARFCPWAEPLSLVLNYTETPRTPAGIRRLEFLHQRRAQARRWWDANGAPAPAQALAVAAELGERVGFRVHTLSPTVQTGTPPPPPPPPPRRVVTLAGGVLVDADTGEVLHEPPPRPPDPDNGWISGVVEGAAVAAERFAAQNPGHFADLDRRLAVELYRHRMSLVASARLAQGPPGDGACEWGWWEAVFHT